MAKITRTTTHTTSGANSAWDALVASQASAGKYHTRLQAATAKAAARGNYGLVSRLHSLLQGKTASTPASRRTPVSGGPKQKGITAVILACLTETPQTMKQLMDASGAVKSHYNPLNALHRAGKLGKTPTGAFYALPGNPHLASK